MARPSAWGIHISGVATALTLREVEEIKEICKNLEKAYEKFGLSLHIEEEPID